MVKRYQNQFEAEWEHGLYVQVRESETKYGPSGNTCSTVDAAVSNPPPEMPVMCCGTQETFH